MARLDQALYWKYPGKAITCSIKPDNTVSIIQWPVEIPLPTPAEQALVLKEYEDHLSSIAYIDQRRAAYPPIGDQLDNITKALKYMKEKSVDIGPDGQKQVAEIDAVKTAFPKPTELKPL